MSAYQHESGLNLTPSNSQAELIKDGWFSEKEAMWPGQRFGIQVEEVLCNGRSEFQDILVFKSSTYGTVLALDGVIQVTERDEFSYQEMITHIPMFANKQPKKVLIIGGGDGGVLREVAKHSCVEVIHMCEIDRMVCEVGKKYFTNTLSTTFNDPRLTLMFDDAARYLKNEGKSEGYDVIICDSSDPVGPAEVLFQPEFFLSMRDALAPGGVLCTQGECMWLHLDLIAKVLGECRSLFPSVRYAYTTIPTYPSGQIGFIVASNDATLPLATPHADRVDAVAALEPSLQYYSHAIHNNAFVLPAFAARKLN